MTAKEMFEALGWELVSTREDYRNGILYYTKTQGSAVYDLDFYLDDKTYFAYGTVKGQNINCPLSIDEHLAITQQMKELGWIDESTLEHLFGDTQYDIDKLTLIDDDTPYQLYGTEAQHFKNHMAKVSERKLKKPIHDANDDKQ